MSAHFFHFYSALLFGQNDIARIKQGDFIGMCVYFLKKQVAFFRKNKALPNNFDSAFRRQFV